MNFESSNPALNKDNLYEPMGSVAGENVASVQGVVNKTSALVAIATVTGALAYAFLPASGSILMISCIAAFVICLGAGFMLGGNPALSPVIAPIYAAVEGVFLGMMTKLLDVILAQQFAMAEGGMATLVAEGSLALPAFIISMACVVSMLALYTTGLVRPTARFKAVMGVLIAGAMITYLAAFVLSFFGVSIPFFSLNSAMQGGSSALIGMGICVFFLGIASFTLILDFGRVESIVDAGAPKYMEWYAAFGLMVTLAWIYYEALKLSFRLAILLSSRD